MPSFNPAQGDFKSPLTAKGDLYTYGTGDARLPVGTNNQVLIADSTQSTGLKWGESGDSATTYQTSATALPGSPSSAQSVVYTDIPLSLKYDGTRWRAMEDPYDLLYFINTGVLTLGTDNLEFCGYWQMPSEDYLIPAAGATFTPDPAGNSGRLALSAAAVATGIGWDVGTDRSRVFALGLGLTYGSSTGNFGIFIQDSTLSGTNFDEGYFAYITASGFGINREQSGEVQIKVDTQFEVTEDPKTSFDMAFLCDGANPRAWVRRENQSVWAPYDLTVANSLVTTFNCVGFLDQLQSNGSTHDVAAPLVFSRA